MRSRALLLLFDNCEQVIEAVAAVVTAVLDECPDVRVLATSRRPLAVAGEFVLAMPPLSLPTEDANSSAEALLESEAVRLFFERARAVNPSFALTPTNAAAVAAVCRGVDGLPLAVELAAATSRAIPLPTLADRVGDAPRCCAAPGPMRHVSRR